MVWGKLPVDYQVPKALDFSAFELFGTTYPAFRMFMLLISLAIFIALLVIMTRSRIGLIIQAALTHPHMVAMLGHNVPKRSEEHTSELQSLMRISYPAFCLKKNT